MYGARAYALAYVLGLEEGDDTLSGYLKCICEKGSGDKVVVNDTCAHHSPDLDLFERIQANSRAKTKLLKEVYSDFNVN